MDRSKLKWIWIGLGVLAAIVLILWLYDPFEESSGKGIAGKYVGTESGKTFLGETSTWETVLELKKNGNYTLTVTRLQTGTVTLTSSGTYKLVGESQETIIFTEDSGKTYQGEYRAAMDYIILGSSGFSSNSGIAHGVTKP